MKSPFIPAPWTVDAACVGHDPELWYSHNRHEQLLAQHICALCPVQHLCAEASKGELWGIWAGQNKQKEVNN